MGFFYCLIVNLFIQRIESYYLLNTDVSVRGKVTETDSQSEREREREREREILMNTNLIQ